jgi:hypothetical protein
MRQQHETVAVRPKGTRPRCAAAAACTAALHTCAHRRSAHVQEEDVTTLEARLHAATEHNNNLRGHTSATGCVSAACHWPSLPPRMPDIVLYTGDIVHIKLDSRQQSIGTSV